MPGTIRNFREGVPQRIAERAGRLLDRGENVFTARSLAASIAIGILFDDYDSMRDVKADGNDRIIAEMTKRSIEGLVYADRMDLGNGYQDSTDFVVVTSREGQLVVGAFPAVSGYVELRGSTPQARIPSNVTLAE